MLARAVVQQIRRDFRALFQGLVGETPASFHRRAGRSGGLAGRSVVVRELRRETADAMSLILVDPAGKPFEFAAGQFFTVLRRVEGRLHKRAYSASSPSTETGTLRLTVKRVERGVVSNDIVDGIRVGDRLELRGPSGSFVAPAGARRLVLIGGGSGITPLVSIARTALEAAGAVRVDLVYGNRSAADVILRADIDALVAAHPHGFSARHVLELAAVGSDVTVGRLDRATVTREIEALGAFEDDDVRYFLCGPLGMMDETRAALRARGVDAARILEERFASPGADEVSEGTSQPQSLEVITPTARRTVIVRPGQTLLEGATAAGVALPFSCTLGGCGACKLKLVRGDVTLPEPHCLSDAEIEQGYVLTCIARPRSACTLEASA